VWSNVISFTTPAAVPPTMTVEAAEDIHLTTAKIKGTFNAINDVVGSWVKKGFIYSTTPNPTHASGAIEAAITGTNPTAANTPFAMSKDVTGLLSGVTYYVKVFAIVKFGGGGNDTIYSPQGSFVTLHACGSVPSNVTVPSAEVEITSAKVKWTPKEGQVQWEIDCGIAGHEPGTGEFSQISNADSVILTGLDGGMSYSVFVRAVCSGQYSDWSETTPFSMFSTIPYLCAPIASISPVEVLSTSAKINWIPGAMTQNKWELLFAKASEYYPMQPVIISNNPAFYPIGLTALTSYKMKVRAICNNDADTSDWSDEFFFMTVQNDLNDVVTDEFRVKIYPNPTTGDIRIDSKRNNIKKIEIINSLGKIISSQEENLSSFHFDKTKKGIFAIKIYTTEGIQIEKVIVQ
jgi:hypothetical protein